MTCCVSSRHVFLFLFTLLYIIDVVFDILAVIEWYRCDHFVWFLIGTIVISISFFMQWLYCLNNMNLYLNYLQSYKYSGWKNYNHYLNFDDTHYVDNSRNHQRLKNISKCKEITFMIFKFLFKSIILHLLLQLGIIEAFIENCIILKRYNTKSKTKKNIFDFDPKNNYNTIAKYPNPVLQFNTNYISAHFADICVLHCYFQSLIMSLLHSTFFLSHLLINTVTNHYLFSIYLCGFITSILSVVLFVFNFEKAKIYPSYFEYDTLSRIKYIFPDLYLYPSTYSIYQITNAQNKTKYALPPPTCHYPTNINAQNTNHPDLPSSSDIFLDQNNHHDMNSNSCCSKFVLFLCNFTFYVYLCCDFCCRTSPFILSFIQLSISIGIRDGIHLESEWIFWMNIAFLSVFTLYLMIHSLWIHHKYSYYFKSSAPFWRYTIKKYLKCHYIHPLRSILETEPLLSWFMRNALFWFGVIIICNLSIFGLIFNRPTLYSRKESIKWHKMRKKVEKSLIFESLMRYFFGLVMILIIVIFDSFSSNEMFYCVAIWTFIYCIFALYCCFIILKISRCSLLRLDGVWIDKVRTRGWLLSRNEEGLIWHRNYNCAQSFQIKRKEKHFRKMHIQNEMHERNRVKQHDKEDAKDDNDSEIHNIAMVAVNTTNEQHIQCLSSPAPATKIPKQNDCCNDTITMDINIVNNINISNHKENDTLSNTTVNSSNINVKISCTNPSHIMNETHSKQSADSNYINDKDEKKTMQRSRPQPSILRTVTNTNTNTNTPDGLAFIVRPSSSEPPPTTATQTNIYRTDTPPHYPSPQLTVYQSHSHPNIFDAMRSSSSTSSASSSSLSIVSSRRRIMLMDDELSDNDIDITTPKRNALVDHKQCINIETETETKTKMVSVKWHKGDNMNPRIPWSEHDMKYPLKWLMHNKSDKIRKEKKEKRLKSKINAVKQHPKITLTAMDGNMDDITKRKKLNKLRDDMISIDETGAFLKHQSSDTSSDSSDSQDKKDKKDTVALSTNIQNTNTKLLDTLRKLSPSKILYHNIPTQINQSDIIYDNSSDDSICYDFNKQNNVSLLVQSYTNHHNNTNNDIGCNIDV